MHHDPSRNAVDAVRDVVQRLAAVGPEMDEKTFADTIIQQLREERLLWPFEARAGDRGRVSLATPVRIVYEISRLSGSAGLIVAMHMSQALTLVRHARGSAYLEMLLQRCTDRQSLVASGTSERGVGGDVLKSLCALEAQAEDGYSLEKDSPNISYLDLADVILVTALRVESSNAKGQVLVALPTDQIKISPGPAGSFLGMRGIVNRPYHLEAHFTPNAIFPESLSSHRSRHDDAGRAYILVRPLERDRSACPRKGESGARSGKPRGCRYDQRKSDTAQSVGK
ncbi:hypothetical protein ACRAWG_34540 [Methylobacterium sp. P31]